MNEKFLELPEEKQLRIINAGYEVFAANEYKKASTEDIAAKACISKGLLFYYFHNKKSLYMFLFDCSEKLLRDSVIDARFEALTDVFELLEYAAQRKFEILQKAPHILDFVLRVFSAKDETIAEDVIKKTQKTSEELFAKYFSNIDYSKFKEVVNPQQVIQMLMWTSAGYMREKERAGIKLSIEELMEKFRQWTDFYKKASYKEEHLV